jgi:hypothetical protein
MIIVECDHTQGHTHTLGRTPLEEGSARRNDLYLTTQHSQEIGIHAPGEIRTLDPIKRTTAGALLRPRDFRDPSHVL